MTQEGDLSGGDAGDGVFLIFGKNLHELKFEVQGLGVDLRRRRQLVGDQILVWNDAQQLSILSQKIRKKSNFAKNLDDLGRDNPINLEEIQ